MAQGGYRNAQHFPLLLCFVSLALRCTLVTGDIVTTAELHTSVPPCFVCMMPFARRAPHVSLSASEADCCIPMTLQALLLPVKGDHQARSSESALTQRTMCNVQRSDAAED